MASMTGAAPKPRAKKSTTPKSGKAAPRTSAKPMPAAAENTTMGKTMMTELRKPVYAYVGAGDLALQKLRTASVEWPKLQSTLTDEATKLPDALSAEMARLQRNLTLQKVQTALSIEQLRELPEQARDMRAQLEDYATSLTEAASEVYQDLVARGERVLNSRR